MISYMIKLYFLMEYMSEKLWICKYICVIILLSLQELINMYTNSCESKVTKWHIYRSCIFANRSKLSCKTNDMNICVCYPKQNGSLRDFSNLIFCSD